MEPRLELEHLKRPEFLSAKLLAHLNVNCKEFFFTVLLFCGILGVMFSGFVAIDNSTSILVRY